jgi:predicted ATPase/DNA-binding XRE family transcriptional regulator
MTNTQNATAFTTFGELLRHLRRRAGMTQRNLGQATGYSEAQIARLEGGSRLPDVVAVKGVFVEAFDLKREPALAAQLVMLAQAARDAAVDSHADVPTLLQEASVMSNHVTVGNLPAPATTLIGREDDIAAVTQYLTEGKSRIVTLVGPGGVGKTQLALEVANQTRHDFVDGTWWVDLAPVTDPQAALTSIAQALEIEDRPGKPILRVLQDHLRDRQALLVLDNLEQVLEVTPLISQMLSATPKVKVLATSRELLRIAGEQGFIVNPLGEDAIDLFSERARAVKPDFAVTEANAGAIGDICRKLDGLPLAIELAAARITLFTPREMLGRLEHRLSLLTGGARDLPARQRTLRATLDWSYSLLTPDEQALFRRLGVFAGGCTLHAIQAFLEIDNDLAITAEEGLAALVAKSLLVSKEIAIDSRSGNPFYFRFIPDPENNSGNDDGYTSDSRYRMLETIREYARDLLLEHGEYDRWVRAMAEYLLSLRETSKRMLPEERENCLSALQWLNSVHDQTGLSLQLASDCDIFVEGETERFGCIEEAIKNTGLPADSEQLVSASADYGYSIGHRGERVKGITLQNNALAWYRSREIRSHRVQGILYVLGHQNRELGNIDQSRHYFAESLEIAKERGDLADEQHLLISMAETEVTAENPTEADRLLDEGMAVQAPHSELRVAWALNHRAHAALLRAEMKQAEDLLIESNRLFSRSQFQGVWGIAWNGQSLGEVGLMRGDANQASANFKESIAICDRISDAMVMSWSLCGLAGACVLDEAPEHGARLWGAGEALREKIGCRIAPASRQNRERTVAMLNAQVGEAEFARLAAEGAAWTLEQAVEAALQKPAET